MPIIEEIIIKRPHIFKILQNKLSQDLIFLKFQELKCKSQLKNITVTLIGIYCGGILE
jgi:hypothetical protein